jgi:hypothetical protein
MTGLIFGIADTNLEATTSSLEQKKVTKSDKFSERWIALPAQAVQMSCQPMALAIRKAEDDTSAAYSVMYVDAYSGSTLY